MPYSFSSLRRALALAAVAGSCTAPAFAQSTTITFTNATPPIEIPLLDGTAVSIDGDGDISAQCQLSPQQGCVGAASGGSKADVLTFTRTDNNTEVTGGESITLSWTTSNASICNASAAPAVAEWSGVQTATGGSRTVTMPAAAGTYNLSLSCYNDSGSTGAKAIAVAVQQPVEPPSGENCIGISGPLVKPTGFTMYEKTWPQAFYGNAYPSTGAPLAPVGSFTLKSSGNTGPAIAGKYITVPFTSATGVFKANWLQAQPIHENGYTFSRPAANVYVTISTCRGDFRLPDNGASDPLLKSACRKKSSSTSIFYSGTSFGSSSCAIEVGKQYYINFLFADPWDGLTTTEDTCAGTSEDQCEVNFSHEKQSN